MGTVNPIGKNVPEFYENLKAGKLGICEISRFDASDFDVKVAGEVKDFDPSGVMAAGSTASHSSR